MFAKRCWPVSPKLQTSILSLFLEISGRRGGGGHFAEIQKGVKIAQKLKTSSRSQKSFNHWNFAILASKLKDACLRTLFFSDEGRTYAPGSFGSSLATQWWWVVATWSLSWCTDLFRWASSNYNHYMWLLFKVSWWKSFVIWVPWGISWYPLHAIWYPPRYSR